VLAPTCFGSNLSSSGSWLDPPELIENTNWGLVRGYVVTWPVCRTIRHTGHVTTRYMIYQPPVCVFK
jgi:hypothetical protein